MECSGSHGDEADATAAASTATAAGDCTYRVCIPTLIEVRDTPLPPLHKPPSAGQEEKKFSSPVVAHPGGGMGNALIVQVDPSKQRCDPTSSHTFFSFPMDTDSNIPPLEKPQPN